MTEKKGRGSRRSDRPGPDALKEKRDAFLHTFFKRGAELSDQLVEDNRKLREHVAKLEEENASLRTQLASDRAIRDALRKIDELEREKSRLLSTVEQNEEITGRITNRFAEVESELESFAYLYVAAFQLHLTLQVKEVLGHVAELLGQLVGAQSAAVYFHDEKGDRLEPVIAVGRELSAVPAIALRKDAPAGAVERAFLTGVPLVEERANPPPPAACVPLMLGERAIGIIVVYELLEQKPRLLTVDRELFKLLGAHAAGAVVGAFHYGGAAQRIPTPAELRAITG